MNVTTEEYYWRGRMTHRDYGRLAIAAVAPVLHFGLVSASVPSQPQILSVVVPKGLLGYLRRKEVVRFVRKKAFERLKR